MDSLTAIKSAFAQDECCYVCENSYLLREGKENLACRHSLCRLCFEEVKKNSPLCPTCRQEFKILARGDDFSDSIKSIDNLFFSILETKHSSYKEIEAGDLYKGIKSFEDPDIIEFFIRRWLAHGHNLKSRFSSKEWTLLHQAVSDVSYPILKAFSNFSDIYDCFQEADVNKKTALQLLSTRCCKDSKLAAFIEDMSYFPRLRLKSPVKTEKPKAENRYKKLDFLGHSFAAPWFRRYIRDENDPSILFTLLSDWLDAGRRFDEDFGDGNTLLHLLFMQSSASLFEALTKVGFGTLVSCLRKKNNQGETAEEVANKFSHYKNVLDELSPPNEQINLIQNNLFQIKTIHEVEKFLEGIIPLGDAGRKYLNHPLFNGGNSLLQEALKRESVELVIVLGGTYKKWIDLNYKNSNGETAAKIHSSKGNRAVSKQYAFYFIPYEHILNEYDRLAGLRKKALERKVLSMGEENRLDTLSADGFNTLHHAVYKGNYAVTLALINAGANPEQLSANGHSPMFLCLVAFHNKEPATKILELLSPICSEPPETIDLPEDVKEILPSLPR